MLDVRTIAKVELHCHTDGLVDPAMLQDMIDAGLDPGVSPAELAHRHPITSFDSWVKDYAPFLEPHFLPVQVWQARAIEYHVKRLRAQHVVYTELFISGWLGAFTDHAALIEAFSTLRERVANAAGPGLQVEFVACIGRGPPEKLDRQFPKIRALCEAGLICGVSLAGAEADYRVKPVAEYFARFRDMALGVEIHAGEFDGPESVWDALEYGVPDRLGHGVRAFEDDALIDALLDRRIHVEFCPTSNLRLGVVPDMTRHPLRRARELGVAFSINTDDPGPFGCSLTSEYELVHRTLGFTETDFTDVYRAAMDARFTKPGPSEAG